MRVTVWFANEKLFRNSICYFKEGKIFNKDLASLYISEAVDGETTSSRYEKMAEFNVALHEDYLETCEYIYMKTQNMDSHWRGEDKPCRSASVGDIIQFDDGLIDSFYIVASCGFDLLFERA